MESVFDADGTDGLAAARSGLVAAAEAVAALAEDLEVDRRDCGTTLMIAIAIGTELVVAHVGDGVIAGRRNEEWLALSKPLGGEHANETFVITDPEMLAHARVLRFEDITACALLTDGAAASLWERSSAKIAPALQKVARALDELDECEVENALRDGLGPELRRRTLDDCGVCVLTADPSVRRSHDEAALTAGATSSVA